jgi:hypothetical protein
MGSILIVVPLVVAGVGILLFAAGAAHLVKGRVTRGGLGLGGGGIAAIIGLAAGLVGLNIQSYSRLTYEMPVAEVVVQSVNPAAKTYTVTVRRLDETNIVRSCTIQGDAWLLSGRVQTWKSWAVELGMNATYTLDQVSNYYYSAAEANGKTITACDIGGKKPEVNHMLPEKWVTWLMAHVLVQDRFFGSASFMPLADGAVYKVFITQRAFNAEPANDVARRANEAHGF